MSSIPISVGESNSPLYSYEVYKDGVYLYKKLLSGGHIRLKVDGIPGIPNGKEEICFLTRKIPFNAFLIIIEFFKYVCEIKNSNLEAYALIGYSDKQDKYCVYIPEQSVTGASVHYNIQNFYKEYPGYSIVMDIHVHPWISDPNFSPTDDNNDINDRFSGVVSDIFSVIPKYKFRFGANGKFFNYNINELFEKTDETFVLNFNEEINKIKIHKNDGYVSVNSTRITVLDRFKDEYFFDTYIKKKKLDSSFNIKDLINEYT
jgi:hypothetical protein